MPNPLLCSTFAFMNRLKITLAIILVSLSLLTLVAIQLYYINSAIRVEESNFQHRVTEAATNIVNKLQKMDLVYNFSLQQRKNKILHSIDSLRTAYQLQMISDSVNSPEFNYSRQYKQIEMYDGNQWETVQKFDTSTIISNNPSDSAYRYIEESFYHQADLLGELIDEMLSGRNPYDNPVRYGKILIDSLIGAELANKGLKLEYEFGIFSTMQNRFLMEKTGNHTHSLIENGFSYQLSPGSFFMSSDYLILFFPNHIRFVLVRLAGMLGISLLIVLILIGAFFYAFQTILHQKKLSAMKNDFINNMTHEFKTPISTVALACEALNDSDIQKSEELYKNYISIISEENKRLGIMAEKILQTAILEKKELKLKLENFDLHEIIHDVIKTMSIQIEIRDGQINTKLDAEQSRILADKVHITNIITNLLDNANKYTPVKPRIDVKTDNTENGVIIMICDNGLGISKDDQKKIFEKLYRIPTGNIHNVKGYGLGLSYVKFIVDKHHGSISVESEVGQGTKFRIFLPFHPEPK